MLHKPGTGCVQRTVWHERSVISRPRARVRTAAGSGTLLLERPTKLADPAEEAPEAQQVPARLARFPPHPASTSSSPRLTSTPPPATLGLATPSPPIRARPASVARLKRRLQSPGRADEVQLPATSTQGRSRRLTEAEEAQLCALIQQAHALEEQGSGSLPALRRQQVMLAAQDAQAKLLKAHQGVLVRTANQYRSTQGASFDDLFVAGVQGLIEAARKYTPGAVQHSQPTQHSSNDTAQQRPQARFISFAQHHIRKHMRLALRGMHSNDVCYIPRYLTDRRARVISAYQQLQSEGGQGFKPSVASVAQHTGLPEEWVADIISTLSTRVVSAEQTTDEEDDEGGLRATWRMDPSHTHKSGLTHTRSQGLASGAGGRVSMVGLAVVANPDTEQVDAPSRQRQFQTLLSRVLGSKEVEAIQLTLQYSRQEGGDFKKLGAKLGVSRQAFAERYERAVKKLRDACVRDPDLRRALEECCDGLDD